MPHSYPLSCRWFHRTRTTEQCLYKGRVPCTLSIAGWVGVVIRLTATNVEHSLCNDSERNKLEASEVRVEVVYE